MRHRNGPNSGDEPCGLRLVCPVRLRERAFERFLDPDPRQSPTTGRMRSAAIESQDERADGHAGGLPSLGGEPLTKGDEPLEERALDERADDEDQRRRMGVEKGLVHRVSGAGERTRTSKGRSPAGPKPAASSSSATPAWKNDTAWV